MSKNHSFDLQMERKKNGLCWRCGKPAQFGAIVCRTHLRYERLRQRKKNGCKPKRPGGDGRPTKEQLARI